MHSDKFTFLGKDSFPVKAVLCVLALCIVRVFCEKLLKE